MSDLIYGGNQQPSPNTPLQRTSAGCSGSADSSVFGRRRSPLNGKPLGVTDWGERARELTEEV